MGNASRTVSDATADVCRTFLATVIWTGAIPDVALDLPTDCMILPAQSTVWRLCLDLHGQGEAITPHSIATLAAKKRLTSRLPDGGAADWAQNLIKHTAGTKEELPQLVALIREQGIRRTIGQQAIDIASRCEFGASVGDILTDLSTVLDRFRFAIRSESTMTVSMDTVTPLLTQWIWPGFVAVGETTVLTGPPGVGKGLLCAYVVARVTMGQPLFGDNRTREPKEVLGIWVEDDHATALAPRFLAAGADKSRVQAWDPNHLPILPNDTNKILAEIDRKKCGLLIIDPAPTLLARDLSTNSDPDVRRAFTPLIAGCRQRECSVLLIRHTNKRQMGGAMDRGGGSIAWTGLPRIELMIGKFAPGEESGIDPDPSGIAIATVKNNLGKWAKTLRARIVEANDSAKLEFLGVSEATADDLVSQDRPRTAKKTESAESFLRQVLADGRWHLQKEISAGAKAIGISDMTLRRAEKALGVLHRQKDRAWYWQLGIQTGTNGAYEPMNACTPEQDEHLKSKNYREIESSDDQEVISPGCLGNEHLRGDETKAPRAGSQHGEVQ